MIFKIISIILIVITIKIFDFIPIHIKVGDLNYKCNFSIIILFAMMLSWIIYYFCNLKYCIKSHCNKSKQSKMEKQEIETNKKIIQQSIENVCKICLSNYNDLNGLISENDKNDKINEVEKSCAHNRSILIDMIDMICNVNFHSAKNLDLYINDKLFEFIEKSYEYLRNNNYIKAQESLENLYDHVKISPKIHNYKCIYENLYVCYIENKEYDKCQNMLDDLYKRNAINKDQYDEKCRGILKYGKII
ncbi:hypothetical protein FZC35_01140 [Candidatus Cytomitobacter indipagum]|uniref:Uncharacterized protein n=1 Tax=Candidatus Cytomitobacter indipagum TaxID=2601575 RepID=A0A5C0UG19_9PROT|nr:hypothetical protein [Candidatus Cytomitobacter indipagum]QEK37984.1 hypothetical protein FZC35_01140 [Candidatus Cytomitobacter indipagum]